MTAPNGSILLVGFLQSPCSAMQLLYGLLLVLTSASIRQERILTLMGLTKNSVNSSTEVAELQQNLILFLLWAENSTDIPYSFLPFSAFLSQLKAVSECGSWALLSVDTANCSGYTWVCHSKLRDHIRPEVVKARGCLGCWERWVLWCGFNERGVRKKWQVRALL